MKIAFHTLGCKVNQYETEALTERFSERGYEIVSENDFADIYVINTCSVTALSDRKSRQYIRKMKKINPDSIVAVTGCYAQISPEEVAGIEGVNVVTGTNEKSRLPDCIEEYMGRPLGQLIRVQGREALSGYDEMGIITSMESRTRAYIKVEDGCNRFCSYCIIPYARGEVRSRAPEEIVGEAEALIEKGFREIILTGINTALYGTEKGFKEKYAVADDEPEGIELLIKMIDAMPGDFRIRLSSLEPTVINKEYVTGLLKYEKLCPHLHLSIQSGSDKILKAMNRKYNKEEYLDIVKILKEHDMGYGITTDIIVGFPGERQEDFEESLELIKAAGFCKVHAFQYSKRPGTAAADMKNHIAPAVKKERSKALINAGEFSSKKFFRSQENTIRRVLIEEYDEKEKAYTGYTDNYIRVYLEEKENIKPNSFANVRLTAPFKDGMKGKFML